MTKVAIEFKIVNSIFSKMIETFHQTDMYLST